MSGSRSLGSPRLEHGLSADSEGGDFMNQPVDVAAVDARLPHSDSQGADSDFDKFDDVPLSVSEHVTQPDVPYSNLVQSHLHQDDENVTDADVDDEFDNDDKVASNLMLSANQNAVDICDKETSAQTTTASDVVDSHVVEYVNSQSLAAVQAGAVTVTSDSRAADSVAGDTQVGIAADSAATCVEDGELEIRAGKVVTSDGVVETDSQPDSSHHVGEEAVAATTTTTTASTTSTLQDQTAPSSISQDHPAPISTSQDRPAPASTPDQQTPSSTSLPLHVSVTQAQIHAVLSGESPSSSGPAQAETCTSNLVASGVPSASPLIADADLNEEIPYILHRRQHKDSEDQPLETTVFKSADTPSPTASLLRQSRSKSPRGRLGREESSPTDGVVRRARADRSPSAGRRFELVHYNKLPARDSFSSVDDTTSPTAEKDFLRHSYIESPRSETKPMDAVMDGGKGDSGETQSGAVEAAEVIRPPDSEVVRPPDSELIKPPDTKIIGPPDNEVVKPPDTEIIRPPDSEVIRPPDSEVIRPPDSEVIRPPDSEVIKPPDSEVIRPPDSEGLKLDGSESQQTGGETKPQKVVAIPDAKAVPKTVDRDAKGVGTSVRVCETKAVAAEEAKPVPRTEMGKTVPEVSESIVHKEPVVLRPPSPPLPPPPSSPPLPPPPRPQNPTAEMEPNLTPMQPVLTTISTNTVTVAKPLVMSKPKPPPVMPKTSIVTKPPPVMPKTSVVTKKPPVVPKPKNAPSKPPRESGAHPPSPAAAPSSQPSPVVTSSPPLSAAAEEQEFFPPPPSEMTSSLISITGDLDLDSLPPPPSELLMDLSSQSSGTSPESPASLPPLSPEIGTPRASSSAAHNSTPGGQKQGKEKRPDSVSLTSSMSGPCHDKDKPNGSQAWSDVQMTQNGDRPTASDADPVSTSEAQRIMDLPSPAAALIFSDSDSPPSQVEAPTPALTFTTFRPDPSGADSVVTVTSTMASVPLVSVSDIGSSSSLVNPGTSSCSASSRDPRKRWSLERVEEEPSAEASEEADRTKVEPKRVSWHEEAEAVHSFHSDISMKVMRSPVDEASGSSLGGSPQRDDIDSGDMMETLENMRRQGSESDLTYSGSSGSSSNASDVEDCSTAKEVYLQYAATKCLAESGKDTTIDSGMGEMSSEGTMTTTASQHRESSPLDTLERLGSMEGSFHSERRKPSLEDFPPPPPFLRSGGSSSSSSSQEMAAAAASVSFTADKRASIDPLLNLEGMDMGEMSYTTSESESDFDEEVETCKLKKVSVCEGAVGGVEEAEEDRGQTVADNSGSHPTHSAAGDKYVKHKSASSSSSSSARS